jgi:hypothetical protein
MRVMPVVAPQNGCLSKRYTFAHYLRVGMTRNWQNSAV